MDIPIFNNQEERRVFFTEGDGLILVKQWARDGLFDTQLAKNIGISTVSLNNWKKKFPKFNMVISKGRGVALIDVENATYKAALGYHVEETIIDNKCNERTVKRWIQPSPKAQAMLLYNWGKGEYKEKQELKLDGKLPVVLAGDDQIKD
jgi:hypothetical protein